VLVELLPTLIRARGRPAKPPPVTTDQGAALTRAVLGYVTHHAGCVQRGPVRQHYSDGFRRFIVELRAEHAALDVEPFASAVDVPLGTLKDWLRDPIAAAVSAESEPSPPPDADSAQMQTVLDAWTRWDGTFIGFCDHVRAGLLVPFGREAVARILHVHGLRRPAHRKGRTPDESALRGSFRTFFPGAQWVGDGMQVPVLVDGQRFNFNFELDVDAYTGAFTGACVRREEDAAAVVQAFKDGVITTGEPPLALLLDNRPSNHTPEVDLVLGDTLRMRATPARPQNKAHVEGAFGLFSQVLLDLVLDTRSGPLALAAAFVSVVVQVWARTTNHRPRGVSAVGRWPEGVHQTSTCRMVRPDMRGTPARRSEAARRRSARGRRRGTIPSSGVRACTEPSRSGDAGGKGRRAWPRGGAHRRSCARRRPSDSARCEAPALSRTARGVAADTSAGVGVAPASPTIGRRAAGGLRRYVDRVDVGLRGLRRRARTWIPRNIAGPEGHACRRTPRRRSRLLYSPSSASPWFTATGPTGSRSASAMQPAPHLSAPSASADSLPVSPAPSPTSSTPSPAGAAQLASRTRYAPNG